MRALRRAPSCAWPAAAPMRRAAFSSTPSRRNAAASPNVSQATPKLPAEITISDSCVERLKAISEKNKKEAVLRLEVVPAGCSGFSYKFALIGSPDLKKDDKIFEKNGARVAVDDLSTSFLQSCTIEWEKSLIREAFKVTNNAKAETACSCGTSFSPKV